VSEFLNEPFIDFSRQKQGAKEEALKKSQQNSAASTMYIAGQKVITTRKKRPQLLPTHRNHRCVSVASVEQQIRP